MITVKKEVDIISLCAFILSVSAVISQLYFYTSGASAVLLQMNRLVVHEEVGVDDVKHMAITMPVTYLNKGSPRTIFSILRQKVSFKSKDRNLTFIASHYVQTNSRGNDYFNEAVESALPFSVPQGQAVSKKTKFLPKNRICIDGDCTANDNFETIENFMSLSLSKKYQIKLNSETTAGDVSAVCAFTLTPLLKKTLIQNRWASIECE